MAVLTRRARSRALILAAATLATTVGWADGSVAAKADDGYQEYVALGDSWTADTALVPLPTTEFVPIDCAQQAYSYPHQVAASLGITNFRNASCGSATTEHMANSQSLPLGGVNPPQFDRLTPTTDLVTLGIGGNDIGLAGALTDCISLLPFNIDQKCRQAMDAVHSKIPAAEQAIVATIDGIRERSPDAEIFLVNYLDAIPVTGCWPVVPITNPDTRRFREELAALNGAVARAASAAGVNLIDTYARSAGHHICTGPFVRWVEAIIPLSLNGPGVVVPAHPNSAGATAQAQFVLDAVRSAGGA